MNNINFKPDMANAKEIINSPSQLQNKLNNVVDEIINKQLERKEKLITKAIAIKDEDFADRLKQRPLKEDTKQEIKERMKVVEPSHIDGEHIVLECYVFDGQKIISFYYETISGIGRHKAFIDYVVHVEEDDNNA